MSQQLYVRLKPYNKSAGHLVQRYHVRGQLFVATDKHGNSRWYRLPENICDFLATKHQNHNNLNSPKLFDIVGEEQWRQIAVRERDMRLAELGLASPAAIAAGADRVMEPTVVNVGTVGRSDALVDAQLEAKTPYPEPDIVAEEVSGNPDYEAPVPVEEPVIPEGEVVQEMEPEPAPTRRRRKKS